jgi:thiamine transport system substrate-binding protein
MLDDEHRVTPIDVGDVCLNYDRLVRRRRHSRPDDLADLTDEEYRGLLAVQNPATSSPGLAFLLATVERFGEDGYLDFWAACAQRRRRDRWLVTGLLRGVHLGRRRRPSRWSCRTPRVHPRRSISPIHSSSEAPTGVIEASCFRQIEFAGSSPAPSSRSRQAGDRFPAVAWSSRQDLPLTMFVFPVVDDAELPTCSLSMP